MKKVKCSECDEEIDKISYESQKESEYEEAWMTCIDCSRSLS